MAGTLALLVGAVLPPFAGPAAEHALRAGFEHLCHQLPGRSFEVAGAPLAVCHRCTGIYVGLVVGALFLPVIRGATLRWLPHDRWVLLAAVLPAAIDWGSDVLGLWSNTVSTRVATGLWLGVVIGVVFARSLALRRATAATETGASERRTEAA